MGRSGQRGRLETRTSKVRRRLLQETFKDFDARGVGLRMSDNLSREELYDRHQARAAAVFEHHAGPDR